MSYITEQAQSKLGTIEALTNESIDVFITEDVLETIVNLKNDVIVSIHLMLTIGGPTVFYDSADNSVVAKHGSNFDEIRMPCTSTVLQNYCNELAASF